MMDSAEKQLWPHKTAHLCQYSKNVLYGNSDFYGRTSFCCISASDIPSSNCESLSRCGSMSPNSHKRCQWVWYCQGNSMLLRNWTLTSWFRLIHNCEFWKVSWKDSSQMSWCCNAVVFLLVFAFSQICCHVLIILVEPTCEHIHLRWWWGWAAWQSETRSRCSSIWKRCCCGDSRTCRSCCLTGAGNESQSGTGLCGQSRARIPGNGLTELQEDRDGTNKWNTKRNLLMIFLKFHCLFIHLRLSPRIPAV